MVEPAHVLRVAQRLQLGGRQSKSRYQYTLQSVSAGELSTWAVKLQEKLRGDERFRDVTSDSQMRGLQAQDTAKPFKPEELDQMLAPIALYPDSLLSQILMAATYPQDVFEAASWSRANPELRGDTAVRAVEKEGMWLPFFHSLNTKGPVPTGAWLAGLVAGLTPS